MNTQETVPVTLRLSLALVESLKEIARERAYRTRSDVSYTDLIREAAYHFVLDPLNNQGEATLSVNENQ